MRFLFVDRIVELYPGERIKGIKHITSDDYYLTADESGRLCFIPSLIGETLGQLAAWNVMHHNQFSARPVAGIVSKACLHRSAYIGETLLLESFIDVLDDKAVQYHSTAKVGEETVFTIDGSLGPLLPMTDFISEEEVRRQFQEIYRPGDWSGICESTSILEQESSLRSSVYSMTFDKILSCVHGQHISAEKRITRAAPYFNDHFPNKPVLPMTVLLECKLNLAKEFFRRSGFSHPFRISELRKIKMNDFIQPGDVLVCHAQVKNQSNEEIVLGFRTEVDGKRVCVLEIVLDRVQI